MCCSGIIPQKSQHSPIIIWHIKLNQLVAQWVISQDTVTARISDSLTKPTAN